MTLKIRFWHFLTAIFGHEKIKSIFVILAIIHTIWNVFIKFRWHDEKLTHGPQVYILCKMYVCLHAELAERAWNAFELMKWRQQQGLSVVHCSHIFPPQQPNMWKKLTWARARRAARPTIAVIFFFSIFHSLLSSLGELCSCGHDKFVGRSIKLGVCLYTFYILYICRRTFFFFRSLNE